MQIEAVEERRRVRYCLKEKVFLRNMLNIHLHFLLREPNNRQSLHHSFPIILVADSTDLGAVPLNKKDEGQISGGSGTEPS